VGAQGPTRSAWKKGNLERTPLEDVSWQPGDIDESLRVVFLHVRGDARDAADWYSKAKAPKKYLAFWTRLVALAAAGVAALLPLLDGIFWPGTDIPSLWVSLAVAVGAGALAADRYLGWSTGWTRYIKSELEIWDALESFELDWQEARAGWRGQEPSAEQVTRMLGLAKAFAERINTVVQEETRAWSEEFLSGLRQLEDTLAARKADAEARAAETQPGSINLSVTNGDQVTGTWTVQVDGATLSTHSGKSAAIPSVAPGMRRLRVTGDIGGTVRAAERVIELPAGGKVEETLTLT